jgi:hypothetical protein
MSNQIAIKEVLNLQILDYATGAPITYVDYASTSEIDNTGTRIDISGGQGNYRLVSFDHSKVSSMKLDLPLVDMNFLAAMMGDTVATGAQNLYQREVVTITAGSATLSQTPLTGTTPSLFFLQGTRDNGTALTSNATPSTSGQYNISGKNITFATADNGKQVVVWYQYASPTTTTKFSMKANKFVKPVKIIGNGIVRDQVDGTDKASVITIYNARFQQNFNLAMSSTNATTLQLVLDMYAVPQGNDLVYYDIVFLT